ncbi:MAG: hypothetical protein ACOCUB_01045, partial [Desulfohalobiaceae bacterium]
MIHFNENIKYISVGNSYQELLDIENSTFTSDWLQIWTGCSTEYGLQGSYVDTSAFNAYGKGWIHKEDLGGLSVTKDRAGHDELWLKPQESVWQKNEV